MKRFALLALALAASRGGWAQSAEAFPKLMQEALQNREQGRLDASTAAYRKALALRPSAAEAWWYLGLNYYDGDKYPECEDAFRNMVVHDKKHGGGWTLLGLCEFKNGKYEPAFAHIVRGRQLGIPPGSELEKVAHYHYVMLTNKIGQFEFGAGLLSDYARVAPQTPQLTEMSGLNALRLNLLPSEIGRDQRDLVQRAGRAAMLAWQKKTAEAKAEVEELIRHYPKQPNVHYLLGYILLLENSDGMFAAFLKELEISPKHVQARLQIAHEYLRRGELAKGLDYAKQAVELAPKEFTARNIHGRILLGLGQTAEAVGELETAAKLAPTSPEAHFHLAAAYARAGRKLDAEKHRKIFAKLNEARGPNAAPVVP